MTDDHGRAGWSTVAASQFVSLGTYRRNGELVSAPIWLAPDGLDLVATSELATGKIRRLRSDDRVVMRPCGRFGDVEPGAPVVSGHCVIVGPHARDRTAVAALRKKYGPQFTAILALERLIRRWQRKPADRVILRVQQRPPGSH